MGSFLYGLDYLITIDLPASSFQKPLHPYDRYSWQCRQIVPMLEPFFGWNFLAPDHSNSNPISSMQDAKLLHPEIISKVLELSSV